MRRIKQYYLERPLIDLHVLMVVISFALWFTSKFNRNEAFSRAGYILLFITVLSFIIHENLRGLHNYMHIQDDVSYLPAARIRRMNGLFLGFYTAVSALIMFLLPSSFLRNIGTKILDLLKAVISRILGAIFGRQSSGSGGLIAEHDINYSQAGEATGTPEWLKALLDIVQQLAKFAAIIVLLYVLYCIIIAVYRRLSAPVEKSEPDVHEYVEVETRRERLSRAPRRRASDISDDPEIAKIRRQYKETILKSMKDHAISAKWFRKQRRYLNDTLGKLTPEEIESKVQLDMNETNIALHKSYESARYSRTNQ